MVREALLELKMSKNKKCHNFAIFSCIYYFSPLFPSFLLFPFTPPLFSEYGEVVGGEGVDAQTLFSCGRGGGGRLVVTPLLPPPLNTP